MADVAHKRLEEKTLGSERVFDGRLIRVRVDEVELPNGQRSKREIVEHPGAVAAVPLTADGEVILVRQWRHPVGEALLEIPAGTCEAGEEPLETIKRELIEEICRRAGRVEALASLHLAPGYSSELIHLYLATELAPEEGQCDPDEQIELVQMPLREALRMCRDGEMRDAKTVAGLLLAGVRMAG
ncbi:MAG TPA: ADP-ribose pyrophosphatase [Armatimonadetes bacterium]|nr:ADP-ribose pyrophosphatase [Armatimonadota bacterium]